MSLDPVDLLAGKIGKGRFDVTAWKLTQRWAREHQEELLESWLVFNETGKVVTVEPLKER